VKELIRQVCSREPDPQFRRLALSECLQHLILQSLYRHGAFQHLIFSGGTALRILYATGRYSEDLDFSLEGRGPQPLEHLFRKVQKDLQIQGFPSDLHTKREKTVWKADLRFPGLLQAFDLSPLAGQKLTVKCEVDTRPPRGGIREMMLVTTPVSYTVAAYNLPSLFALKLHAIFCRSYTKGRDYYDLVWYLGKRVVPNFKLLNSAILQTEGSGHEIRQDRFKLKLMEHLKKVDVKKVRSEAERFVIDRRALEFLDTEPIQSLLRHYP